MAVFRPAAGSRKRNLSIGQIENSTIPFSAVGQTVTHIHNRVLLLQHLIYHMKGTLKRHNLIYIVIINSQDQGILSQLLLFPHNGKAILQVFPYGTIPVKRIALPDSRPGYLIVVKLYGASHCHIDVLRQIRLDLGLIFLELPLKADIPNQQRQKRNHKDHCNCRQKSSFILRHMFYSGSLQIFVSLQIKIGRFLVSI